jgi:SAM-dependent methyltransferase
MSTVARNASSSLQFSRQRLLQGMPRWLRDRLDLHHTRINELVSRASREASPGQRVLDAGAGEGRYRPFFGHLVYTGLDLGIGDATWDYTGLDVVGDLLHMPFEDGAFDLALSLEVLEHVTEPRQVLAELSRVVRPGGKLYLSTPMSWHQHQKPHDYFRYTSFGLRYLLNQAGFDIVELRPTGGYFWFLSIQFQMLSLWVFPRKQGFWLRVALLPIKVLVQALFFIVLPLLCYYLDSLDHQKDQTMAWTGIAIRRESAEPYQRDCDAV